MNVSSHNEAHINPVTEAGNGGEDTLSCVSSALVAIWLMISWASAGIPAVKPQGDLLSAGSSPEFEQTDHAD